MILKILKPTDKLKVHDYLDKLPEDKKFKISITMLREVRSYPQNRLYWMWIGCICDETGGDKEGVHRELGEMFLPKTKTRGMGEIYDVPLSTTKLNTLEFKNYLDRVQVFSSSELGIILPNPEDLYFDEFKDRYKNYI